MALSLVWVVLAASAHGGTSAWPLDRRLLVHVIGTVTTMAVIAVTMILPLIQVAAVLKH